MTRAPWKHNSGTRRTSTANCRAPGSSSTLRTSISPKASTRRAWGTRLREGAVWVGVDVWMCGCVDVRMEGELQGVCVEYDYTSRAVVERGGLRCMGRTASEGSIDDSKCSNSWYTPCRSFIFRYNENTFSLPRQMQNLVARANVYEHYAHYPWYIKWFIRCAPS